MAQTTQTKLSASGQIICFAVALPAIAVAVFTLQMIWLRQLPAQSWLFNLLIIGTVFQLLYGGLRSRAPRWLKSVVFCLVAGPALFVTLELLLLAWADVPGDARTVACAVAATVLTLCLVQLLWAHPAPATAALPAAPAPATSDPQRRRLAAFRKEFLRLTGDGQFTPERQQQLFQAARQQGLDWAEARRSVAPEAQALFARNAQPLLVRGALPADGRAALDKLQQRLALTDEEAAAAIAGAIQASYSRAAPPPSVAAALRGGHLDQTAFRKALGRLPPANFAVEIGQILGYLGWQDVRPAGGAAEQGIDLAGRWHGQHCVVQCRNAPGRAVAPRDVRELVGALHIHNADRALLITSGGLSPEARQAAAGQPVELWTLEELAGRVVEARK
ncbi:MAG TPA: restriction endonuclease [Roseiflexaceae bacterium]|nr:restriction endonuclease [Roseiflexaceae bacterium]